MTHNDPAPIVPRAATRTTRVAVVGAGLAGLIAAASVRRQARSLGLDLELVRYERSAHEGGRARSPALGGVAVNSGPRAVYRGAPLERALSSFGIVPLGFRPPTAGALAIVDGALTTLPATLTDLIGATFLDAAEKRAVALAIARLTIGSLGAHAGMPIGAWLDRHGGPRRSRQLLHALVRVSSYHAGDDVDAAVALRNVRRALMRGVTYVDNGWQTLVDALRAHAGPPPLTRALTSLDDIDADRLILALPMHDARALAPAASPQLASAPPATASCLDVIVRKLPRPRQRFALGIDQPTYVSVHTSPERVAAGAGPIIVHAMGYGSASREELEGILDLLQPGWRDELVEARYLSRMIVSSAAVQAGVARSPRSLDIGAGRPVFLAGDHVDCGELLADCAAQSAVDAAGAVVESLLGSTRERSAAA